MEFFFLICIINIYIRYEYSQKDVFTTSIAYISSIKNDNSGTSRERFFNSGTFNNTQEHVPQEHVFFVPELKLITKKNPIVHVSIPTIKISK